MMKLNYSFSSLALFLKRIKRNRCLKSKRQHALTQSQLIIMMGTNALPTQPFDARTSIQFHNSQDQSLTLSVRDTSRLAGTTPSGRTVMVLKAIAPLLIGMVAKEYTQSSLTMPIAIATSLATAITTWVTTPPKQQYHAALQGRDNNAIYFVKPTQQDQGEALQEVAPQNMIPLKQDKYDPKGELTTFAIYNKADTVGLDFQSPIIYKVPMDNIPVLKDYKEALPTRDKAVDKFFQQSYSIDNPIFDDASVVNVNPSDLKHKVWNSDTHRYEYNNPNTHQAPVDDEGDLV